MIRNLKKMKLKQIIVVIGIVLVTSCSVQKLKELSFLEGTWQIENKSTYEEWIFENNNFVGVSYKLKDQNKRITETLLIKESNGQIIYEATVTNQNNGSTIPFVLNTTIKDKLSFENLEHDFPKKIQYKKLTENEILVSVLGTNDKGFEYKIIRIK